MNTQLVGITKKEMAIQLDKANALHNFNVETGPTSYNNYTRQELIDIANKMNIDLLSNYHKRRAGIVVPNKIVINDLMETYPADEIIGFSLQYNHLETSETIYAIDIANELSKVQLNVIERKGYKLRQLADMLIESLAPIRFEIYDYKKVQ